MVMIPTIHINGSSAKSLKDDLKQAHRAMLDAIEAVSKYAPHDRDYYVQPDPQAGATARQEQRNRLVALNEIKNELEEIWLGIEKQVN